MSEKLAQSESIPVAYEYQHEETGVIGYVDPWQIENGFFKNNSRLQLIGPLYRHPPPESALQARIDALTEALKSIANPIAYLKQEAEREGYRLNGGAAVSLASDAEFLKGLAKAALLEAEK